MGIPASDHPRLFERYYRASNATGMVGTGLGLYLVKTVVELHGGEVRAESLEGEGSCFQVRLPLSLPSQAQARTGGRSRSHPEAV
jgi:signal transduction histidine kinase